MEKLKKIEQLRKKLKNNKVSIGTWMQIPNSSVAEILGSLNLDWIVIDIEHGSFSLSQLPDIFRAIELGEKIPLVRIPSSDFTFANQVLDAGAMGLIIPNIKNKKEINNITDNCLFPPFGKRGIGYSRANLFGKNFKKNLKDLSKPIIIAQIESLEGFKNLEEILKNKFIDAVLIGPYDLSASIKDVGNFKSKKFNDIVNKIKQTCKKYKKPCGIHVVNNNYKELSDAIKNGFRFIPYSIDSVILHNGFKDLKLNNSKK